MNNLLLFVTELKAMKLQARSSEDKEKGTEMDKGKGKAKAKAKSDHAARAGKDEEDNAAGNQLQAQGGNGACLKTSPC